jgi:hypothetical protein
MLLRFQYKNRNQSSPLPSRGWDQGYNFGSIEAARLRWRAALDAGVNLIATDQYEDLADFMKRP